MLLHEYLSETNFKLTFVLQYMQKKMSGDLKEFYFLHYMSDQFLMPRSQSSNPPDSDLLAHYKGSAEEKRIFMFEPVSSEGHYGYIKHKTSGKYLEPTSGYDPPTWRDNLRFTSKPHPNCLFIFDEATRGIIHKSREVRWRTTGWDGFPPEGGLIRLYPEPLNPYYYFFRFVNSSQNDISPYPDPKLEGKWIIAFFYIDPDGDTSRTEELQIGYERTQSATAGNAWEIGGQAARKIFKLSASFRKVVEKTTTMVWSKKVTISRTITPRKGYSVYTWQYILTLSRFGDEYTYRTNIFADTDNANTLPDYDLNN